MMLCMADDRQTDPIVDKFDSIDHFSGARTLVVLKLGFRQFRRRISLNPLQQKIPSYDGSTNTLILFKG